MLLYFSGEKKELENPSPNLTLAKYLRENLHLTGTKIGCGTAGCGSCTVTLTEKDFEGKLVHRAVNACIAKVWTLHGSSITTVEGLGTPGPDTIHPIQERIHKSHGLQCGYCTPGMVMSLHSEMRTNGSMDIEDVQQCLRANLCRCTGYRPIIEGFRTFCKDNPGSPGGTFDADSFKSYSRCTDDPQIPGEIALDGPKALSLNNCFAPKTLVGMKEIIAKLDDFEFVQGGTGSYQLEKHDHANKIFLGHIEALKKVEVQADKVCLGLGLKLAEALQVLKDIPAFQPFKDALSNIGGPQLINQATIGGSIFWKHPSSDLWPLYLVYECQVKVDLLDGTETKLIPIEEVDSLKQCLVVELVIPHPANGYFGLTMKKARRKQFDLAIVNMGGLVKINNGKVEDLKLVLGGTDQFYSLQSGQKRVGMAKSVMSYLIGKVYYSPVKDLGLIEAIENDLKAQASDVSTVQGNLANLRVNIATHFVQCLIRGKVEPRKEPLKFHQFFPQPDPNLPAADLVTKPIPHLWGDELACGTAVFVDDMKPLEGQVTVVLVRSERAHAKLTKLDLSAALACKGILGGLTAADVPGDRNLWGSMFDDEEMFVTSEVMYHGQVLAALVCIDKEHGDMAKKKVLVEYEDLPFVINLKHAKEHLNMNLDDLPVLKFEQQMVRKQDEQSIGKQDTLKLDGTLRFGSAEHFYIETHAALAVPIGEKDEMVVYHTCQGIEGCQAKVAKMLGVPINKITVKSKRIGGAFGGKERSHEALIAALAAKKFKRPVKCTLSRSEDMGITGQKHETVLDYDVSVDKATGKILEAKFKAWINAGISSDLSVVWTHYFLIRLGAGYTLHNFEAKARPVKTNHPSTTAMRGFSGPETTFYMETILDRVAHELKMSPLAIKEVNMTKENDLLHHSQKRVKGCNLQRCWEECIKKSNYDEKLASIEKFNVANKEVKRGLAIVPMKFEPGMGHRPFMKGFAFLRVYADGSVLLSHGGAEMGQGLHTKMIQVASRALGIPADWIHISETSTETIANASPTGGSTGTDLNGPAVIDACEKILAKLEPFKKAEPEGNWKSWVHHALHFDRVCLNVVGIYDTHALDYNMIKQSGDFFTYMTYGVGVVQTEVNCMTGQVDILSTDIVMDLGKSLNPAIDIGQIEGAFVMGLGLVTTEQMVREIKTGKLLTEGPGNYKIPTVADIPKEFNVTLLENSEGPASAVYSSKGIGEPALIFSAAVVMSIKDAIASFRRQNGIHEWFHMEPPCTSDKIVMLAHDQKPAENPTVVEM